MSYEIHNIIDRLKPIEKNRYLVLFPFLMIFMFVAITTSQSITYTNTLDNNNNIAFAQITNQTTTAAAGEKVNNESENVSLASSPSPLSIPNTSTGKEINASSYKEAFTPNRQITLIA